MHKKTFAVVSLTLLVTANLALSPVQPLSCCSVQDTEEEASVGAMVTVGETSGVDCVGKGVNVAVGEGSGVSVGGTGVSVEVGIAACVCVSISYTFASAVARISSMLVVGVASFDEAEIPNEAQELSKRLSRRKRGIKRFIMGCSPPFCFF
jgi:hypothetical protein